MIGTGYVGLVSGVCFSDLGNTVYCVDKDKKKIDLLNQGTIPIFEPGLEEILKKNKKKENLFFTTDLKKAVINSDIIFVCVGTPNKKKSNSTNLKYVFNVIKELKKIISKYKVIVTKSTVPVTTGDKIEKILLNLKKKKLIDVVSNPEFLREGSAINDFMRPDRVVIGCESSKAKKIITCHDLIAIRTAHGEFPYAPKTSRSGKRLQRWIHNSLKHADYYACDSLQTKQDLARLVPGSELNSAVIHLGTDLCFSTTDKQRSSIEKLPFNPSKTNYLLHVGSASWYKNRKAVFKSFRHSYERTSNIGLKLILVGPEPQKEELDASLSNWFQSHRNSLICLNNLSENSLIELYKHSKALVFPSYIEGFGWPPLEAALHGCPVISTRTGVISDLLGSYVHYVDAEMQASIDQAVIQVLQSSDEKKVNSKISGPSS